MGPPEGSTGSMKPSPSSPGFRGVGDHATQKLPRAWATGQSISSNTTAEAGNSVFAPELHHCQNPPPPGGCLEQALSHRSDIKHRHRELPWSRAGAKPSVLFPHVANTSGVPFEDGLDTES